MDSVDSADRVCPNGSVVVYAQSCKVLTEVNFVNTG